MNLAQPVTTSSMTPDLFRNAFRHHAAGVAVITADAGSGPVALTVTSVISVSVEPPLLVFSVSEQSSSTPSILAAETVIVHLLAAPQIDIAKLGATSGIDRFADKSIWMRLPTGEPCFHQAASWLRARIVKKMKAGNATVVCAEAVEGRPRPSTDGGVHPPLVYHDRTWYRLGREGKLD
jgi:flavin reductase (DIM6/NTAB) family NADH-FMN oxidoreductase RutF